MPSVRTPSVVSVATVALAALLAAPVNAASIGEAESAFVGTGTLAGALGTTLAEKFTVRERRRAAHVTPDLLLPRELLHHLGLEPQPRPCLAGEASFPGDPFAAGEGEPSLTRECLDELMSELAGGESARWTDAGDNVSYRITVRLSYEDAGARCREYHISTASGPKTGKRSATACWTPQGGWQPSG